MSVVPLHSGSVQELTLKDVAQEWRWDLVDRNLAPLAIRGYVSCANVMADWLEREHGTVPFHSITEEHARGFLRYQLAHNKGSTADYYRVRLSMLWKRAVGEDLTEQNVWARIRAPKFVEEPPKEIPLRLHDAVMEVCRRDRSPDGRRDGALLSVLWNGGFRRFEAARMTLDKVEFKTKSEIRAESGVTLDDPRDDDPDGVVMIATVLGKGRKWRTVALSGKAPVLVQKWLTARRRSRYAARASLWVGVRGPLTPSAVTQIFEKRTREAGWPPGEFSPHDYRATCAIRMLRAGVAETVVRHRMGWTSGDMLVRYTQVAQQGLADSMAATVTLD
jgi:integrase/recombinase XerC